MAIILAQNALVELATVLGELGLSSDPSGNPVTRLINVASSAIESYLTRPTLFWQQRTESYGSPGQPAQARLKLETTPVWPPTVASITQVSLDLDPNIFEGEVPDVLVPGQDFYFEDGNLGWLFRQTRWFSTALRRPDIVQDSDPQAIEKSTQVIYLAGWVTPVQIDQALTAWPAGTSPAAATLLCPASQPSQVWGCTPTTVTPGAVGAVQPSWPASPAQFATIVDGATTWTFLGYNTTVTQYPQARTLPQPIEQAAIDTVVTWYRRRGSSLEPTASKFGDASQTYGTRLGLPTTARDLLAPYRQIAVG